MQAKLNEYYYRTRLREELVHRISRNPAYSLRSFSAALEISSGSLSQILSGKRSVSTKLTERIFKFLELSPSEQQHFLESLLAEKQSLRRRSPLLAKKLKTISNDQASLAPEKRELSLDEFRVISDWYHAAILELTFSEAFDASPRWIAQALGITIMEAKLALDRLLTLNLLENVGGRIRKSDFRLSMKDQAKTTVFLRRRQKQILEKSITALENTPLEERNHSGVTLCLDPGQIPEAKLKIRKFMWELSQQLVQGKPERVYELSVNLIPLQKKSFVATKKKENKNEIES